MSARTYHHGDLKAALRAEAEKILIERGSTDFGLREVARAAGVSHNAPYRHYANREALIADVAAAGFERLGARFSRILSRDRPDRLVAAGLEYVRFAEDEPAVFRLMFGPDLSKPEFPDLNAAADRVFALLREELLRLGLPAPATSEALAAWATVHGLAVLFLDNRIDDHAGSVARDEVVTDAMAICLAGLRARLKA